MVKVIALVTIVAGKNKEFKTGTECELSEKEATQLAKRGFVKLIVKQTEEKGQENATSTETSSQQPV